MENIDIVSIKMVKESSACYSGKQIIRPSIAVDLVKNLLCDSDREKVIVLCLDVKNFPTSISIVSVGTVDTSVINPRDVFKTAILSNSSSIILFHNHPTGILTPSAEDISITKRLDESGKILGIRLFDHIIVGPDCNFLSLKEENYF